MDTTNHIQQQGIDTCAIKSQQLILEDFGINISEPELVKYSIYNGWYEEGAGSGTKISDIGRLLDAAKIPCTSRVDANMYDLANELQQGHKIIVGVDSGELWKEDSLWLTIKEWFEDMFGEDKPDHALIVAGIDASDPNDVKVLVTDPGTGEKERAYPLAEFMDAWQDSQCFMCSTNVAPPGVAQQYHENAEKTGDETWDKMQLPEIPGVDKQAFQQCGDYFHAIQNDEDFRAQMPSLSEWFDTHQLTWEKFRPYDLLPYFTQMNSLASPMVFPEPSILPPSPIMPCDFNYNSLVDTSWMCQPYTPMNFPPVEPMQWYNPVFQPITPSWYTPINNVPWSTQPLESTPHPSSTIGDEVLDEPTAPHEDVFEESDELEEIHEELSHELSEVENVICKIEVPSGSTGFEDIDTSEDES